VIFEVLTVILLKIQVFLDLTLCLWGSSLDISKDHSSFIIRVKQFKKTLKMKAQ